MKTRQSIVAIALSTLAVSTLAGNFPGNPERDVIDQTMGTTVVTGETNDGWKDFGAERGVQFVGGVKRPAGGGHVYTREEMLQARMDYREASN
jgi:hypothetical protein